METENTQIETQPSDATEKNNPDYIAMQYRVVRIEDGWKTRKERIGAAWKNEKGGFFFRPAGQQIIEGDVHFFPVEESSLS